MANIQPVTREAVLAAIVAGDRTVNHLTDRLGIEPSASAYLSQLLNKLVCEDLLEMKVVDRAWHYLPTASALSKGLPK